MTDDRLQDNEVRLVEIMADLKANGLNAGRAGNASFRVENDSMIITPSAVHPRDLSAQQMARVDLMTDSEIGEPEPGSYPPSSEWRMHRDIYRAFKHVNAIVHTHSPYATALACQGRGIPAFHYMVAVAGGDSINCAPYATFGSQTLSEFAVDALYQRSACLLANHGVIATGSHLAAAADLALEVEQLAAQYAICLSIGEPQELSPSAMREVIEKFKTYGKRVG